jgi:hypothetical protein
MHEVKLTQGQVALVDDCDKALVDGYKWCAAWNYNTRSFYAIAHTYRDGKRTTVSMHRIILGLSRGTQGDHRNHDTMDNRRDNLRPATASQNAMNRRRRSDNTSGMRGVRQYAQTGKWVARIGIGGKLKHLGYFLTPEDAYAAYGRAAAEHHGEFMRAH